MELGPVKIQKIDYLAVNDAVDEVADGPAHDESKGRDQAFLAFRQPSQHHSNETDRQEGKKNEEGKTISRVAPGENTKGRPGVADIGQAKQLFDHRERMVQGHGAIDDELGELVQENNKDQQT